MTHRLAYDIARCMDPGDCPLQHRCLRELADGNPHGPQPMSPFEGGDDCSGFIEAPTSTVRG